MRPIGAAIGQGHDLGRQVRRRIIRPVHVLDDHAEGSITGHHAKPLDVRRPQAGGHVRRREVRQVAVALGVEPNAEQTGPAPGGTARRRRPSAPEDGCAGRARSRLRRPAIGEGCSTNGPNGDRAPYDRLWPSSHVTRPSGPPADLRQQPRLADPRLPDHQDDLPLAAHQAVEHRVQAAHLGLAPDQRAADGHLADRLGTDEAPGAHRLCPTLDRDLTQWLGDEASGQASGGLLPHDDRAWRSPRLEAGGDVRRIAKGHHLRVLGPDQADARAAAVHAHPDAELRDSPGSLRLSGIGRHELHDAERGPRRPFGVVFVSHGHAEVGADAVPLVRLHRPAVLLDRLAHPGHALPDEGLDLVGGEAFAEPGRAGDVGEQRRDGSQLVRTIRHARMLETSARRGNPRPGWTDTSRDRCCRR